MGHYGVYYGVFIEDKSLKDVSTEVENKNRYMLQRISKTCVFL